jgi:hypothetical protein
MSVPTEEYIHNMRILSEYISLSDEGYTRNVLLIIFWMQGIIIQLQFKHLY